MLYFPASDYSILVNHGQIILASVQFRKNISSMTLWIQVLLGVVFISANNVVSFSVKS